MKIKYAKYRNRTKALSTNVEIPTVLEIRNGQMSHNQVAKVIQGRNNVFEDLGLAPEEALNLKIRADLMLTIKHFIQTKEWTQKQAAVFFGETQPRISDLINGDIERFSIDKLVIMIAQAGMEIHIEVNVKAA